MLPKWFSLLKFLCKKSEGNKEKNRLIKEKKEGPEREPATEFEFKVHMYSGRQQY